jgi:hypothetical protein
MRSYRVDIETDSTIQADVTRSQENAARFVEGFGAFIQAIGPAVQTGQFPPDVAADLLTAFSRSFKLGRQAEDALERLSSYQPPEQPDPNAAEGAKLEVERERMQGEMALKQAEMEGKMQLEREKMALEQQNRRAEMEAQAAMERERMGAEMQRHSETLSHEREKMNVDASLRQAEGERSVGLEREKMASAERSQAEAARAKSAPESKAAEQIAALAEGVQQVAQTVADIGKQVEQLGAAVAEVAEDMAAPVEAVRGGDGRIAEVRRGKRVLKVARGEDGRAAGLI